MNQESVIVALSLVVLFMIHDFEEIILYKWFCKRQVPRLVSRAPKRVGAVLQKVSGHSTAAFALAVSEEFLLIAAIVYFGVFGSGQTLLAAAFVVFTIHLLMHVLQAVVSRGYTLGSATAAMMLPVCLLLCVQLFSRQENTLHFTLWVIVVFVLMAVNLGAIHRWLMPAFDNIVGEKRR